MRDHRSVTGLPPVSRKKPRHYAVATPAVPHKESSRTKNARELGNDFHVIARVGEESERREKIDDRVEASGPFRRHPAHVAARVSKPRSGSALASDFQEVFGVVEPIDIVSGFGEQVRVPALPAWHVQDSRSRRQSKNIEKSRDFVPVILEREYRLILEEIVGIKIRLPPFSFLFQKKTGSL